MSSSSQTKTTTSSGGGSSTSTTTSTPMQQEYYKEILANAQNLHKNYRPEYYKGKTVADHNAFQMEAMNNNANWATGGAQDMMANQNDMYRQMMSGQVNTGAGSPYGDMQAAFQNQAMDGANAMMSALRSNQVSMGQAGGSSRGDLLNNEVINQANQQVTDASAQMYNNAYNQAQATQNNALGQYQSIMNMPMDMSKRLYNEVGLPLQQMDQARMNAAQAKHNWQQQQPWQNLTQYAALISGNFGGTNTSQSNSSHHGTTTTKIG